MEPIKNDKDVNEFQDVAKNPAETLYLAQSVLVQKKRADPKVERQLFMSGVSMYLCHKAMITRRFLYRMIKTVVVALLSGECLIMMEDSNLLQEQPDLLIDSFEFRESIVNLILRFNRTVNVVYKDETVLEKYITYMEKGVLTSTPINQTNELA